ncbi:HdeA/HdeB family chaperone [Desulfovibrio aminophilus]|uniref:HdeA/HdeB family chaperone n=1 Tax=Desulfovibrio aminophilus TaxID=81425 RepID=UPI00041F0405|nr:HdeA/HdeB family chaperone [Desulfovibrio aminophilus]
MRRVLGVLSLVAVLFTPVLSAAQSDAPLRLDMKTYTCREFLREQQLGMVLTLFWLDGYANAKTGGDMVLDSAALDRSGSIMVQQCTKTPAAKVLDVFRAYVRP